MLLSGFDIMNSDKLIFKKRSDTSKVYVFLPGTGKTLEFKSKNPVELCELLELIKRSSVRELELVSDYNNAGFLIGIAAEALSIYDDLKELQVNFPHTSNGTVSIEKYIKAHNLYINAVLD